jgi:hypothetical protein
LAGAARGWFVAPVDGVVEGAGPVGGDDGIGAEEFPDFRGALFQSVGGEGGQGPGARVNFGVQRQVKRPSLVALFLTAILVVGADERT